MSDLSEIPCPHCHHRILVKIPSKKSAAQGAGKSAAGAFMVAIAHEVVPNLDLGPHLTILATWAAGQIVYSALTPTQWRALLGGNGK